MSWIIGTSSGHIDLSNDLVAAAVADSLQTVDSVAAGGSSYVVGDVLTLSGGTFTIAAQVEVTAVSTGAVTAVRRVNDGAYTTTITPSDPVSTTGGTGTGCTLNCTFAHNGWTPLINQAWSGSDREVLLSGEGGGTDEIFVGWRTYQSVPGNYANLELHGMTGHDAGLDWDEQPGISQGFHNGATAGERAGCYLLCSTSSIAYWISVTPYRIWGIVKVGSAYFPFYLGWGNRFATSGEYPYPLVVSGNTSLYHDQASQSKLTSGLVDPWRSSDGDGNTRGPMLVYMPDGTWYGVANSSSSASARSRLGDRIVLPTGRPDAVSDGAAADKFMSSTCDWGSCILQTALSGNATANLYPTPGTDDTYMLVPTVVVFWLPSPQVPVELDNCYWVSAFGGMVSEDRIIENGEVYRVFQNCNRTDVYAYMAIKEG